MVSAAQSDPVIAARVKHYLYRTPFEFYDYQQDPDALQNRIDDQELQNAIQTHRRRLIDYMRSSRDPALPNLQTRSEQQVK